MTAEQKRDSEVRMFPIQPTRGLPSPTTIPWSVADRAYSQYVSRFGNSQTLERLAERGGFSAGEMDKFYPAWRQETSEIEQLRQQVEDFQARFAAALDMLWFAVREEQGGAILCTLCNYEWRSEDPVGVFSTHGPHCVFADSSVRHPGRTPA